MLQNLIVCHRTRQHNKRPDNTSHKVTACQPVRQERLKIWKVTRNLSRKIPSPWMSTAVIIFSINFQVSCVKKAKIQTYLSCSFPEHSGPRQGFPRYQFVLTAGTLSSTHPLPTWPEPTHWLHEGCYTSRELYIERIATGDFPD